MQFKQLHDTISYNNQNRRIRVLHTLGWVASGGVEQLRLVLASGLPKDKYEHVILTQETAGGLPELLRAEGWKIHEWKCTSYFKSFLASTCL